MIPNNIVEFVTYILPGFLLISIYKNFFPSSSQDNFKKIIWSIFWGSLIYSAINIIDSFMLNNIIKSYKDTFPNELLLIILYSSGIIFGILGALTQKLINFLADYFLIFTYIAHNPDSLWTKINLDPNNKNQSTIVYIDDGSIYIGFIKDYSYDPKTKDYDFLLIDAKRLNEKLEIDFPILGAGVYLNTRNIKRIEYVNIEEK